MMNKEDLLEKLLNMVEESSPKETAISSKPEPTDCTFPIIPGGYICFTGTLEEYTRKEAIDVAEQYGLRVSLINRNLNYLIVGNKTESSSKIIKAKNFGVHILDEKEFKYLLRMLGNF